MYAREFTPIEHRFEGEEAGLRGFQARQRRDQMNELRGFQIKRQGGCVKKLPIVRIQKLTQLLSCLTKEQRQILTLFAQGHSDEQIAREMWCHTSDVRLAIVTSRDELERVYRLRYEKKETVH